MRPFSPARRQPGALLFFMLAAATVLGACDDFPSGPSGDVPPGMVLLIGDGMGPGAVEAARIALGALAMESLPVRGALLTSSASHQITDSGAAATALAAGTRTYNGAIGVDADTVAVETLLEAAEARGWATGLVATSEITHATPASFASHVSNRAMQYEIAVQMAASGVDALLGGGAQRFSPASRPDGTDLFARFAARGCTVRTAPFELHHPLRGAPCLVGLIIPGALAPAPGREVSLAVLAEIALETVVTDPDGFFLMIEGSQIDWAAHANDGPGLLAEMADFDAAVAAVIARVGDRPNTVIVVTADHETGGLGASPGAAAGEVRFTWTTGGHTATPVPLFGQGLELPGGSEPLPIDEVGRILRGLVVDSGS